MGHKFSFTLRKDNDLIYISHLDLMRLLARSARRARLKVELTQGFNPHPKIKMKKALKLGLVSINEEGELSLVDPVSSFEVARRLNEELPFGIEIRDVRNI